MTTTDKMFELRIKETCEEIRHVQSRMNDIVVRYIEDAFAGDTETGDTAPENLRHDMLLALRHYQDTLFATITLLRRKYDNYSIMRRAKLDNMDKTYPETPNYRIRPMR